MFQHFVKIAFRNILRQKAYSFINIVGLALGLACTLFILLWINDELSYDKFHTKIDNLYRLEEDQKFGDGVFHTSATPFPAAPVLEEEIPEITESARTEFLGEVFVQYGDKSFSERSIVAVDPAFLEMFTYPIIEGDQATPLSDINSIAITQELAEKYFGTENPIGKILNINNKYDLQVTAILEDIPSNSYYTFEALVPFEFLKKNIRWSDSWGNNSIRAFLQLVDNPDIPLVNQKMTDILKRNNEGTKTEFVLMPYKDLRLHAYSGFGKPAGRIQYIYIFAVVALFVLLIACVNFMNLSTAKSSMRAKEIGMRKAIGALRSGLVKQFYGESILMGGLGMLTALLIVALLIPAFNSITDKEIGFTQLLALEYIIGLVGITLLTGFIAGSYPALFLSSFRPITVLKNSTQKGNKGARFRQILVVFQFSISIALIVGTTVVFNQLEYMYNKDLGFNKDQVIYIPMRNELKESYELAKNELAMVNGVINITGSRDRPGRLGSNSWGSDWDGKNPEEKYLITGTSVDYDYIETLDIKMHAGRSYSKDFPGDLTIDTTGNFIVNEVLAKLMGENVIGKRLDFWGVEGQVIGIVKDFHTNKLNREIAPMAMILYPPGNNFIIAKLESENINKTLEELDQAWSSVLPNFPFTYKFSDEDFAKWYEAEQRMFELLKYFAVMAIIIACLGLFGLAAYSAERRTKEIGIRKVLGASEFVLTTLLCKEFVILVAVSNLIALPLAYQLMSNWLNEFAYPIELGPFIFVLSALIAFAVAIITVSFQAIKASLANPVEALKYE